MELNYEYPSIDYATEVLLMENFFRKAKLIQFRGHKDTRGNLTFIEGDNDIPFKINRVYYIYDVPYGASRAGHAHRNLESILIPLNGAFDVILDDGESRMKFEMRSPEEGLLIPKMIWRELENFTSGAVCLALASAAYDEGDYFRKYEDFKIALEKI